MRWLGLVFLGTLALGACGGKSALKGDAGTDAGGAADGATSPDSGAAGHAPDAHRATATPCPSERPPTVCAHAEAGTPPPNGGECNVDSDCTAGRNGRCNVAAPFSGICSFCSYDQCFSDTDCPGETLCECRTGYYEANTCRVASCHVDADCGERGYCSNSVVPLCPSGGAPPTFSEGYFCHTSQDTCFDDDDCPKNPGGPFQLCRFAAPGSWQCVQYQGCPN